MPAMGEQSRERTIDLDDGRILGYAEYGEPGGAPILYLHGLLTGDFGPALRDLLGEDASGLSSSSI